MKRVTFFLVFLLPCLLVHSQAFSPEEKQGWYEDYDQFLGIVENANPQLEIRKLVTGEDILDTLRCKRKEIKNLKTLEDFYAFFYFTLCRLNDFHAYICSKSDQFEYSDLDSISIEQALDITHRYGYPPQNKYPGEYFPLYLSYIEGDYVVASDFYAVNSTDPADSLLLPIGSIIKTINRKNIESYFPKDISFKWDNKLKKKYAHVMGPFYENIKVDEPIFISYLDEKNVCREFVYDPKKYKYSIASPDYLYYGDTLKKVEYFENEKILYIRTPFMFDPIFYLSEIYLQGTEKEIKKVIWDIRKNPGGDFDTCAAILLLLMKDSVSFTYNLACLDADSVYHKFRIRKSGKERIGKYGKVKKLPFLEKSYKVWNDTLKFIPFDISLQYDGPIYILQDNRIYSAAGALSTLAYKVDKLKTVGVPTGYLLGFGYTPVVFQLKNTRLAFRMEPVIDVTDIKKPYDYYHDNVDIPVELTREDWVRYWKTDYKTLYSKEFLFNYDPIFRKALEQ